MAEIETPTSLVSNLSPDDKRQLTEAFASHGAAVNELADRINFVMQCMSLRNSADPLSPPQTLLAVYGKVKAGMTLEQAVADAPKIAPASRIIFPGQ